MTASLGASLSIAPAPQPWVLDATWNQDLTKADGGEIVLWPIPRSPKNDVALILKAGFAVYGITTDVTDPASKIPIFTSGIFEASVLRSGDGKFTNRPVIDINLSSDVGSRMAIGDQIGSFLPKDLVDALDQTPDPVVFRGEASSAVVDIMIYDTNEQRADQLYVTIKTMMLAAAQVFASNGYIEPPLRIAGSHGGNFEINAPAGTQIVFERSLTYSMKHLDFIAGVSQVVSLIAEQLTVDGPGGSVTLPPVDV